MKWLRWVVLVLALTEGGWMAYDGGRALLVGDYVTPSTGEYAGQLGPWKLACFAFGAGICRSGRSAASCRSPCSCCRPCEVPQPLVHLLDSAW
jgi:hypothetical protein